MSGDLSGGRDELRRLADAAFPAPWSTYYAGVNQDGELLNYVGRSGPTVSIHDLTGACSLADARFIAAARNLVPALLDRLDAVEAENSELRAHMARLLPLATDASACLNEATDVVEALTAERDALAGQLATVREAINEHREQIAQRGLGAPAWADADRMLASVAALAPPTEETT